MPGGVLFSLLRVKRPIRMLWQPRQGGFAIWDTTSLSRKESAPAGAILLEMTMSAPPD